MSHKKSINKFLFIENVLGIYRNTPIFPVTARLIHSLAWFAIFIIINTLNSLYPDGVIVSDASCFLATAKTTIFITLSYITRGNFQSLLSFMNRTHKSLRKSDKYIEKVKGIHSVIMCFLVLAFSVTLFYYSYGFTVIHMNLAGVTPSTIVWAIIFFISDIRSDLEMTIYIYICMTIYVQLEHLRKAVEEELRKMRIEKDYVKLPVADWCSIYGNIGEITDLQYSVFGFQMTFSMGSTIFYQIYIVYVHTSYIMKENSPWLWIMLVITFLPNTMQLCMLSRAGQRVASQAARLHRRLAALRNNIHFMDPNYRPICELLRLVSSRPLHIEIFGSIYIGNALLPRFLMFFMSYLIIVLQINNIV